jgi:methanogenic corrinoid protein MtbC1
LGPTDPKHLTEILHQISSALADLNDPRTLKNLINEALSQNIPPSDILERGLRAGLQQVGTKYEAGEYFLAELLFAATILDEVMEVIRPRLDKDAIKRSGTVLLGTVRGDMHDIGKNVFKMMAEAAGFRVVDLNVDVDPEVFVEESKTVRPHVLGLSCLLTTALPETKVVVEMLSQSGIRNELHVLLGGNAVTKEFARDIGADAAALNAVEGVDLCRKTVRT